MSREIKFEYIQKCSGGRFNRAVYSLDDLESGKDRLMIIQKASYGIVARRQFTGLKDKNGVEIYEGDVLRHPDGDVFWVEWFDSFAGFRASYLNRDILSLGRQIDDMGQAVVVGNKFENPDLLEG